MASWRDQLKPGTYKGAPFYLESHEFEGGRRIVDHVFPYRDKPWTEDLGLKQRQFKLDLYIIGDDYFAQRDRLIDSLESSGPGVLSHPYLGEKTVECDSFTLSETKDQGGLCKFSVSFKETARRAAPASFEDPAFALGQTTEDLNEHCISDMAGFDVSGLSQLGLGRVVDMVNSATDKIQATANSFPGNLGVAELGYSIRSMKDTTLDLIRTPQQLARSTVNAMGGLLSALGVDGFDDQNTSASPKDEEDVVLRGREQRQAFRDLIVYPLTIAPIAGITPSRVQERENQRLFGNLVKASGLGQLAIVSSQTTYATYDEAIVQRNLIISEIEVLLKDPKLSDAVYSSLMDLQTQIVRAIPGEFSEANRISNIRVNALSPSLALTYELYGTLKLEQDLILRNKIKNPGFINSGVLEALAGD